MNTSDFLNGLNKEQLLALHAIIYEEKQKTRKNILKRLVETIIEEMPEDTAFKDYEKGFKCALVFIKNYIENVSEDLI